ncbi:hypothetical protein H0H87_007382 [Tephrocybe sp. NHM501043]|nr:hypothetical protein H0H87_007382 [Tephrocybe sp. NHM501043]
MLARLPKVDLTLFRRIALFTVFDSDFPTPLRDFLNLSLVCRASWKALTEDSAPLYFDIFAATFDILGPMSRLGKKVVQEHAEHELKRRFAALRVLQKGDLHHPNLTEAFWVAYLMFEDSDKGHKNVKHLLATGLNGLLNSTAEFYFDIATYIHQPTASTVHGPYPPPPLFPHAVVYFGPVSRTMRVPSISLFATLSFFARKEVNPPALPPHLFPENRLNTPGPHAGPTLDDFKYFNEHCQTPFADFPGIDVGVIRGHVDAARPTIPASPTLPEPSPYKLGNLTGRWQGSFILPFVNLYENWLTTLAAPPDFVVPGRHPLYMSLQEHYVCEIDSKVPSGHASEGTKNAWLPAGFKWVQQENGIEMTDENGSFKSFYHTFQRGDHPPIGQVVDVIITGKASRMVQSLQHGRASSASVKCVMPVMPEFYEQDPVVEVNEAVIWYKNPAIGNLIGHHDQLGSPHFTLFPTMTIPSTLDNVPQEVLEHIAFFSATDTLLGPPAGLVPLLLLNRNVYSRLAISTNHHLYARIYASKFDLNPVIRRLGPDGTTPDVLAIELPRRFQILKRIRDQLDCLTKENDNDDSLVLQAEIVLAYCLMLENEGKNERQLREYARIDLWLREYWFHEHGASRATEYLRAEEWLPETRYRSMAMWLFWFLFNPGDYTNNDRESWNAMNVLKAFALAAHKYELTNPAWHRFIPISSLSSTDRLTYLSEERALVAPPLAAPAILSFLTLVNKLSETERTEAEGPDPDSTTPSPPFPPSRPQKKLEWECEWQRCVTLGRGEYGNILAGSFRPGSPIKYTEFTAYASLLSGGQPQVIQRSMAVRHRQTWKLREHHLLASKASLSVPSNDDNSDSIQPLPAGDPLRSYFPTGTQIRESRGGINVHVPNKGEILRYRRASTLCGENGGGVPVLDIIITGEGHSAWGQFNLVGRVRPCDGFVSLSKEYVGLVISFCGETTPD